MTSVAPSQEESVSRCPHRLLVLVIFGIVLWTVWPGAQGAAPAARIKIDIDRVIGDVHPHVFGNFAEHLGRMIYGGLYEEGSPSPTHAATGRT